MARADHIFCRRTGYTHHGIDLGDGTVIHYTGEPGAKNNAEVRRTSRAEFANGDRVRVRAYRQCDAAEVTVQRALSRLGEREYHLLQSNCEHFVRWCKTGVSESDQVNTHAGNAAATTLGGIGTTAAIGAVSTAGSVAGLSGAGVMSGLAAVGGSAVGGMAVLGAIPAAAGVLVLNNTVFKDDVHATDNERRARKAAQVGTTVGAVSGTAGAIGTVAAAGTVAGLSGAGITSGLAAIGGVVGGGMVAGTAAVVAAPLVVAAAVGGGIYGLYKLFSDD